MSMITNLKLYGVLTTSTLLVWQASKKSPRLQQLLQEPPFVFQILTRENAAAYFELKNGQLRFYIGRHAAPDLTQCWQRSEEAVRVLLSSDETDVIRAFEDGSCDIQGSFLIAMWFNEAMKISRSLLANAIPAPLSAATNSLFRSQK
jgi:hypothetical protein